MKTKSIIEIQTLVSEFEFTVREFEVSRVPRSSTLLRAADRENLQG